MILEYVQVEVEQPESVSDIVEVCESLTQWYILFEDKSEGVVGIVPKEPREVRGLNINFVLSNLKECKDEISWIVYTYVVKTKDAVSTRVYTYSESTGTCNLTRDLTEDTGEKGEWVCHRLQSEYDIDLRFDWEQFSQEYAVSREV